MQKLTPQEFFKLQFAWSQENQVNIKQLSEESIFEFVKQYAQHLEESAWISVDERLPEIEQDVLLFNSWKNKSGELVESMLAGYLSEFTTRKTAGGVVNSCDWRGSEYIFNITHWRPLPKPPTQ